MLVFLDELPQLPLVSPLNPLQDLHTCKSLQTPYPCQLQLPDVVLQVLYLFPLDLDHVYLFPEAMQLSFEGEVTFPLHGLVKVLLQGVATLQELDLVLVVVAYWVKGVTRGSVEMLKVRCDIVSEHPTDQGVFAPDHLGERCWDHRAISSRDLKGNILCPLVQVEAEGDFDPSIIFPSSWWVGILPGHSSAARASSSRSCLSTGVSQYRSSFLVVFFQGEGWW